MTSRQLSTANHDFYVSPSGNDTTGTGLTSGSPWKTLQKAWDHMAESLDLANKYTAAVHCATGTYTQGITAEMRIPGQPGPQAITFVGSGNPASTKIEVTDGACFLSKGLAAYRATGFTLKSTNGQGVLADNGRVDMGVLRFNTCGDSFIRCAGPTALISQYSNDLRFFANSPIFAIAEAHGQVQLQNTTLTIESAITCSNAIFMATQLGMVDLTGCANAGAGITGKRYEAQSNGVIVRGNYTFPGTVAGTIESGGRVIDINGQDI